MKSPDRYLHHANARQLLARRRLAPLAMFFTGCAMLIAGTAAIAQASTRSVTELQAEVDGLKRSLEKAQQELDQAAKASAAPAPAANATVQPDTGSETQLGKVVVRARNRIEYLQDVPLSISVVAGAELEKLQAVDVASITRRVANVTWNPGNPRQFSLSIRGVGKQAQTDAQDPSVGIIVDGVNYAYNPLSSSVDFTDVEAVEVTRGPQGTLLGKNTSLGVINIATRPPSFTPEASASLSYGKLHTLYGTATLGGPVIDDLLAWRGTITARKGDGDVVNRYNPDLTYANVERFSGRLQFLLTPSPNFSARFRFDAQPKAGEASNGRTYFRPTPATFADGAVNTLNTDASTRLQRRWFTEQSSYTYADDYLGNSLRSAINADNYNPIVTGTNGASVQLDWNRGSYDLTSITAYKDYYFDARNDEGTPFDISKNGGGLVDYRQYSQELRLSSQTGGLVDYQAGLFFIATDIDHTNRTGWGSDAGGWFANPNQYLRLDANGSGRTLLQNSLSRLYKEIAANYDNRSTAIFAQANWHVFEPLTLTTGARLTREDRKTSNSSLLTDSGAGVGLNPSVINGVRLGGFDSYFNASTTASVTVRNGIVVAAGTPGATLVAPGTHALTTDTMDAALAGAASARADAAALQYFGVGTWAALSNAQKRQLNDAQAIRRSQVGVLWNTVRAASFEETQPAFVVSPSFRIKDNLSAYASWQYGEKAGIAQIVNGLSYPTEAEKSSSYELGLKSVLFDNTLVLNADIFLTHIRNYQQSVQVLDQYTTTLNNDGTLYYTAYTGNVPKVQARGLEIDGVYAGIPHTTVRFSGSYNEAVYKKFANSAQPVENGNLSTLYRDITGQTLPGASKVSLNIGVDYRRPAFADKEVHASLNTTYNSRFNSDNALSSYGWIGGTSVTDFAVGLSRADDALDVNFLVKNLFDDGTYQNQTWNSWSPALPRWYAVEVRAKFR